MKEHPALEAELEKTLREDPGGTFLTEFHGSLHAFVAAVDAHLRGGLTSEEYRKWGDLQRAAGIAAQVAEEVHQRMHDR
jgi:hypothetical protein